MLTCFVCKGDLEVRHATGRKSGKPFLLLKCQADGRHFRGFIYDPAFIARLTLGSESQAD
jgi:hypothetical protein